MKLDFAKMYKSLDVEGCTADQMASTPEGKQLVISTFCHTYKNEIEEWKKANRVRFYKPSYINLLISEPLPSYFGRPRYIYGVRDRSKRANIAFTTTQIDDGKYEFEAGISMVRHGDVYEHRVGTDTAVFNLISGNTIKYYSAYADTDSAITALWQALLRADSTAAKKLCQIIDSWENDRHHLQEATSV